MKDKSKKMKKWLVSIGSLFGVCTLMAIAVFAFLLVSPHDPIGSILGGNNSVETETSTDESVKTPSLVEMPKTSELALPIASNTFTQINMGGVSENLKTWASETDAEIESMQVDNKHMHTAVVNSQTIEANNAMPANNTGAFIAVIPFNLQTNKPYAILMTEQTEKEVWRKIQKSLQSWCSEKNKNVVFRITEEYENQIDNAPKYIRFEVYSFSDKGKSINWNILVFNTSTQNEVDYATLSFADEFTNTPMR
jgi:hypothetical protein